MDTMSVSEFLTTFLAVMSALFVFAIGVCALIAVGLYVVDITQTKHAIRRNFPVIGRLRYVFENLGKFFRQYFFAMDREEMPFNREQRGWVYRAAKNLDNTVPFGSTRNLRPLGTILFANATFPALEGAPTPAPPVTIGPDCPHPYAAPSFFNISAMSFGAISKPAVLALSKGARMAGCWMNTGEGGLTPWHLEGGADIVFQIGTAKYGVRDDGGGLDEAKLRAVAAHPQVRMFEIKLSQGAKPGKGGILPAAKVTPEIATIRGIPVGRDSISPNRHRDIGTVGELLDFVERARSVTGKPTGFKLVIGDPAWLDDLFREIKRRGRSQRPRFHHRRQRRRRHRRGAHEPDGLHGPAHPGEPAGGRRRPRGARTHASGSRLIASGKLITPAEVAWALCVGADFVNSARGFMFALGCMQSLQCNRNTCPTGITTHDPRLQKGLDPADKAERVGITWTT